ncbi:MAG: DNA-methyltransferase [Promethearchaeia archaeon]
MSELESNSVDLVVTSPPYPMIEMWDSLFCALNEEIGKALDLGDALRAFELMHLELEKIWDEVRRVLKLGGIVCINIGDATRTLRKVFQLFPNHVKIIEAFRNRDFILLPSILWRKPTNTPNKFLGSGMLPPNAYATLEHEYILIFRKGKEKRGITSKSEIRYNSAYFWEERNFWFSDIWMDIKGVTQKIKNSQKNNNLRDRSAAFPLEIPYRLINMYSLYGDLVLDPFWGTGTTTLAAIISARNSIGYELNPEFKKVFEKDLQNIKEICFNKIKDRLEKHIQFIENYRKKGKDIKYKSEYYNFPVITQQEQKIMFYLIENVENINENMYQIKYSCFKNSR